ncbi:hypothetical protein K503DRAFT_799080 [Rhizopogon vinicolor AM-OR11-026]|uniref:SnoaL-like domain-containing protein n=1 Tax=Rhizopogon vinicolor AM-OR11-026 TaxID=1314800 RepID=A0A1B7N5L8_9AGAM|nr:hypothetical protein K503DRAFT_799080 [Rhizopogon vinicolor AM-OR11-026]
MPSKPDLISWTQSHLGALYEARDEEAFTSAFDAVFFPSCKVRENHTPSTLSNFTNGILSHSAASAGVTLSWENLITTGDSTDEPSVVSGTLIVTRYLKFLIRAAPAQHQTYINFSAKVENRVVQADEYDDLRHITSLYYSSVDTTPPIHFATPHPVSQDKQK